jgi:hypothetical protein
MIAHAKYIRPNCNARSSLAIFFLVCDIKTRSSTLKAIPSLNIKQPEHVHPPRLSQPVRNLREKTSTKEGVAVITFRHPTPS